jgi:hypothetical protein
MRTILEDGCGFTLIICKINYSLYASVYTVVRPNITTLDMLEKRIRGSFIPTVAYVTAQLLHILG